jgi:hypothetical protein
MKKKRKNNIKVAIPLNGKAVIFNNLTQEQVDALIQADCLKLSTGRRSAIWHKHIIKET